MKLNNLHNNSNDPKDQEKEGKAFLSRYRTKGGKPPSPVWVKPATPATFATPPPKTGKPKLPPGKSGV
jgi:hypothetical protein